MAKIPTSEMTFPPVPYERHVFVCTGGADCPERGGENICGRLKARAKAEGITKRIRVQKSGCMNQCAHGPMMVIYPEAIWYAGVTEDDLDEIFTRTVLRGEPIKRLLHGSPPSEG